MTSRGLCERKCENKCRKSVTQGESGVKRRFSGCVKVVVGWILVTHDGNGGLRSCDHRHGVGVKKGAKWGSLRKTATLTQNLPIAVGSGGQGEAIL